MVGLAKGLQTPLFLMAGLMLIKSVDLTNPSTIFYIRVAFIIGSLVTFTLLGLIYLNIQKSSDLTLISLKKSELHPPSPFDSFTKNTAANIQSTAATSTNANDEIQRMTVKEYDLLKLKQHAQQSLTTFCIVGGMHLYMGFLPPLFLQSYMLPLNVMQSELMKIHLLKQNETTEGLTRPFGSTPAAGNEVPPPSSSSSSSSATTTTATTTTNTVTPASTSTVSTDTSSSSTDDERSSSTSTSTSESCARKRR